jgi:flagellar motor switch protein FliN
MNDSPSTASNDRSREYMQVWAESFTQVLSQIAGSSCSLESRDEAPEGSAASDSDLHFLIAASGGLRGEMCLRLAQSSVISLAQLLLGEVEDKTVEYKTDHREAAEELLRQVVGHVATSLKETWGEVQLRVESSGAPSWPAGAEGWIVTAVGAPRSMQMKWQLSAALIAGLRPAAAVPSAPEHSEAAAPEGKLDLLMDVELDVTLRFGGRRMLLREILELGAGSVVELDRELQEPADLLLDGRLIARGEVVVVDGSYGLRVTEILSTPIPA